MGAPVTEWQLVSTRPGEATAFLGELFGWHFDDANALGYRRTAADEGGVRGGAWPAPPEASDFVQVFVTVDNVAQALERAQELGGRVVVPRSELPDGDVMAVVAAPGGSPWGLMERRRG